MLSLVLLQSTTPVPRDIPLPLPLPEWLLVFLLVISFLMHILFVNLMVGGSIITTWYEIKGLKNKAYDVLAEEIAKTITVNKSMAVVLGVAPLLCINTLYTVFFYSANALTGFMWILLIPLITVAFLLTYLHKYTWKSLGNYKILHISITVLATLLFLFIPIVFLVNINLMLFPEKWHSVHGFISAMALPNVFPRYFHFLCATLAITGLFMFWYMGRKKYHFEEKFPAALTRKKVQRQGYAIALGASAAQFLFGPIVMISLPAKGFSYSMTVVILSGVVVAAFVIYWLWISLKGPDEKLDRHFRKIILGMTFVVICMVSGRHVYRAIALLPNQKMMAVKTDQFEQLSRTARLEAEKANKDRSDGATEKTEKGPVSRGKEVFQINCASCHALSQRVVGPPELEMIQIYGKDPEGMVKWIKHPGHKRPGYPQMPAFEGTLTEQQIHDVVDYVMSQK